MEQTDFASLLKHLRLEAGLSQEALAAKAGVSTIAIGSYERAFRTAPRKEMIAALVDALQLSGEAKKRFETAAKRKRALAPSADEPNNNLPWQPTSFIGRKDTIAEITALLTQRRLVTITGAGGIGKTRTVLEIVSRLTQTRRDGVWFVDLSSVAEDAHIPSKIASTLKLQLSQQDDLPAAVVAALRQRELVLILDNCEHIIAGARSVAGAILQGCPLITLIATSRERLGIAGERAYPLSALPLPDGLVTSAAVARGYEAIALFAERAEAAKPGFVFSDKHVVAAEDICRRLDGIALAIELAAAQLPILGISEICVQLSKHFHIVGGGRHDLPARQQTLRATIAWSHNLLNAKDRVLFRRLAIFSDAWAIESAQEVCADATLTKDEVLGSLSALAEKSLVAIDVDEDGPRYSFFASTRAFALERLGASAECPSLARRHAEWIASIGDRIHDAQVAVARARGDIAVISELEICAALEWAFSSDGDALIAARIAGAVLAFRQTARLSLNARKYVDAALERISAREYPLLAARLLVNQAQYLDSPAVAKNMQSAIASLEPDGSERMLATCYACLASALSNMGRASDAEEFSDRAAELLHRAGLQDTPLYADFLVARSNLFESNGSSAKRRLALFDALALAKTLGMDVLVAKCKVLLAEIEFNDGNVARAIALATEALTSARRERSILQIYIQCNLACYFIADGKPQNAEAHAREALALARTGPTHPVTRYIALGHLATIDALSGLAVPAARIIGHIDAWYERTGSLRDRSEQVGYDIAMAALRKQLSNDALSELSAQGAALSHDAAIDEVQELHNFGQPAPNV